MSPRMIEWGQPAGRPENRLSIRLLGWTNLAIARLFHQLYVRNPPRLPRTGPAIIVCNHTSGLDPLLIQSCCLRLIVWMMAKEYYDIPRLNTVFKTIGAIPVSRNGRDMHAMRLALRALEDGHVLGVFPEGKIEKVRGLLPFQTGVALLAIKSGVRVIPAYLEGTQRGLEMRDAFIHPQRARIAFGPDVIFDRSSTERPALEAATEKMSAAVQNLANLIHRRL